MMNNDSKYDSDGVLKTFITPIINKGDTVSYIDTVLVGEGRRKKSTKVRLIGIWDGEKVEFDDKDKTVVRNKRWLRTKNN